MYERGAVDMAAVGGIDVSNCREGCFSLLTYSKRHSCMMNESQSVGRKYSISYDTYTVNIKLISTQPTGPTMINTIFLKHSIPNGKSELDFCTLTHGVI